MYNLILAFIAMFLFSACGGSGTGSSDTGSISFNVDWDRQSAESLKSAIRASSDVCSDYGIETIHASVFNSSNSEIASMDWTCSAHSGTISSVPVGSNYTVYLQGLDSSGTITWQGSVTGISVTTGPATNAGTITMTYIGGDTTQNSFTFNPLQGATNVPVTTAVNVTFSVDMAPSTINTATFTLFDPGTNSNISGSVTYDSSTKTATFTPSANLSYSTMYQANLQAGEQGILDFRGMGIIGTTYTQFTTEDTPTTAPSAPTDVTATAGDSEVEITWTASTGATSYNIYWSTTSGVTKTNGTKITGATSPYTHTGRTNGTIYYYVVTAVNSYGESGESSQVSATPTSTAAPSAPTGVNATAGDGQVTISWTASTGATSYNIYYSTTSGVTKTTGTKISSVTSPYTHTGLTNGTTYYYIVTAFSGSGESDESLEVSATPTAATTPVTLASGLNNPWGIAVDSTSVYWTERNGGTVKKIGINGGTLTTLTSGLSNPTGIAIDSINVYWVESGGASGQGTVKKVNINGGTVTTLASGLIFPQYITIDSTSVYWTEEDPSFGTVKKVATNGGTVTTLASEISNPHGIAVDSTSVYWSEYLGGTVKKVAINGGTVTTLASGLTGPQHIAIDSSSVYWTEFDPTAGGYVKKVGINGGAVPTLASGENNPNGIVVDSTNVYWTEYGGGTIKKVAINGGTVTTLTSGLTGPQYIAVDSINVYWTEPGSGTVKKIAK